MQPLLKWTGGKRWQVPMLRSHYRPDRRLVEPFCGGLSISLGLEPERALLNDINPHLINFYRWVQRGAPLEYSDHDPTTYYTIREMFNKLIDDGLISTMPAAELFYVLNHWCFNGLCRFNKRGHFNTPRGHRLRQLPQYDVAAYEARFNTWMFTCGDFTELVLSEDDFIYCDPPYDGTFAGYSSEGFTWADQERLASWLRGHAGPSCVCNAMTPRIIELYESIGWSWIELDGNQSMQRSRGRTDRVPEILAFNHQFAIDNADVVNHDRKTS